MKPSMRSIRLSWSQLVLVMAASALATTLIIGAAMGHGPVPSAMIAALRHRIVVHRAAQTTPARTQVASAAPSTSPSPSVSPASDPATGTSAAPASSAAGSDSSDAASASSDDTGSTDTASTSSTPTSTASGATKTPAKATYKVKHVFVIALSTTSYQATWGHRSAATYLDHTLRPKGTLLSGYQTLGSAELPDYLAMVSGQAPNADTKADCSTYAEFPATAKPDAAGQMSGRGCVYPSTVLTIGDQVTASGKVWKAYVDDMGSTPCVHPNDNAVDDIELTGAGPEYATRHNPFIYFHSLLDLGDCSNDDVSLNQLPGDLRSVNKTPKYSFIAPGLCDDASQSSCPDSQPGGLAAEDAFLKLWVPRILASAAYRQNGALVIAFASTAPPAPASTTSPTSTTSPPSTTSTSTTSPPSTTSTSTTTSATSTTPAPTPIAIPAETVDKGPVRTGALIISRFAKRGKTLSATYGPYSLLRSLEDLFGYTPLANAAKAKSFVETALPGA
jgi:cytoskeletal protein RodZ